LAFALLLAMTERFSRGNVRYNNGKRQETMARMELRGARKWAAMMLCFLPVTLGVVIPVIALGVMAVGSEQNILSRRYIQFIQNTLTLASIAAVVTVACAVLLGTLHRTVNSRLSGTLLYIGRLGYAVPGGVIAVGLLVPFAYFDNTLDAWMRAQFDVSTGLLFTGSIWVLVMAYLIRFMAAALGSYEGGIAAISHNVDAAARVLGAGVGGMVRRVHAPIIAPSLLTAALIVFVDVIKELPATLIMRPFNYDTLAVQAFRLASDERLEGAAVPSLLIAGIGLLPVILLCRRVARHLD
jgi:iron(III) transport system permease protein